MPKPRFLTLLIRYYSTIYSLTHSLSIGWSVGGPACRSLGGGRRRDRAIGERAAAVKLGERSEPNRTVNQVNVSFVKVDVDLFASPLSLSPQLQSSSPSAEGLADQPAGLPTEAVPSASARVL